MPEHHHSLDPLPQPRAQQERVGGHGVRVPAQLGGRLGEDRHPAQVWQLPRVQRVRPTRRPGNDDRPPTSAQALAHTALAKVTRARAPAVLGNALPRPARHERFAEGHVDEHRPGLARRSPGCPHHLPA